MFCLWFSNKNYDKMNTINWAGYEWFTRERWGELHPKKSWNWYNSDCVVKNGSNLELQIKRTPKLFSDIIDEQTEEPILSLYGIGLIASVRTFKYGRYVLTAKLPQGHGIWSAFWLYPTEVWPPEIDVFECYAENGTYKTNNIFNPYAIESCVHLKNKSLAPKRPSFCKTRKFDETAFNTFELEWLPGHLKWIINDQTVRTITNKKVLKALNKHYMQVIINTHIMEKHQYTVKQKTPFILKQFYIKNHE